GVLVLDEALLLQADRERLHRHGPPDTGAFGPRLVAAVQLSVLGDRVGDGVGFLLQPRRERVGLGDVLAGLRGHGIGDGQALLLPVEAAADGPVEDAGRLTGDDLLGEALDAFGRGDDDVPADVLEAAGHAVAAGHVGQVVGRQVDLADGLELEELGVEEAGRDGVFAGEPLHQFLVEGLAATFGGAAGLAGGQEALADHAGDVVGDAAVALDRKS